MRRIVIDIDDAAYETLQYLSKVLGKSMQEIARTILESTLPGLAVLVDKVIESLHSRGVLKYDYRETKKILLAEHTHENTTLTGKALEVIMFLKSRGGEASLGEVINIADRDTVEKLVRDGIIEIEGVKVRLTRQL